MALATFTCSVMQCGAGGGEVMALAALTCSVMQCGAGGGEVMALATITCSVGLVEEKVMDLAVIVCCVELMWCQVAPCGARGRGGNGRSCR
ncbi:uncharacterized protein PITG_20805 [Phytophthora infestans T30-4]|uniref:Uncharacterized protein n=1 Tax=Phytophthora infestans (strain T30-4) TaxID=403677 RepID=D0P2R4_PHYIT|nr:uncharacterized protein PITG_20805 [Phytophthora infestans T30-4]EEY56729.1 hypothetical protein PITG_20805 [Phytophthora infestans T30-4]|eukprot:XP_002895425.1 hypothetical protein PITG_20805 [Phytophthora infestans T30-4]